MRFAGTRLALLLATPAILYCSLQPLTPVDEVSPDGGGTDGGGTGPDGGQICVQGVCCPTTSLMPQVQSYFSRKCTGCHPSDFAPDLRIGRSHAALVNRYPVGLCGPPSSNANPDWRLVVPGDLTNSILWRYTLDCACDSPCMSAMSPPCNPGRRCGSDDPICVGKSDAPRDADRAVVQCWILQGAPP